MCASARAIGAREKFDTIWLRGRGISTGRNGTPYGGVLGPGGSRVSGSPDVSIPGNCGEFGTVARRRYGKPVFRTPHGGVLSLDTLTLLSKVFYGVVLEVLKFSRFRDK